MAKKSTPKRRAATAPAKPRRRQLGTVGGAKIYVETKPAKK